MGLAVANNYPCSGENAMKVYSIINAKEKAVEMRERVIKSESYENALEIIGEYVDIIES